MIPGFALLAIVMGQHFQHGIGHMGSVLQCGLDFVRVDAPAAVEQALIAGSLVFIGAQERQSVQRTTVQLEMFPLCSGFH